MEAVTDATKNENGLEEQSKLRAQTKQINSTTIDLNDENNIVKKKRCS